MKRAINFLAAAFLCTILMVFGSVGSAKSAVIDFDDDDPSNPGMESITGEHWGLDWGPGDSKEWQINRPDRSTLVDFDGVDGSDDNWVKGFAYNPTSGQTENLLDPLIKNRDSARIKFYDDKKFKFNSMYLRTREYSGEPQDPDEWWGNGYDGEDYPNAPGPEDGVDDRFLTDITIMFNTESGKKILDYALTTTWTELRVEDMATMTFYSDLDDEAGSSTTPLTADDLITAIKFFGDNQRPANIANHDRFGLDNLDVTIVPIPGAVWLLGSGLIGLAGIRRKMKH